MAKKTANTKTTPPASESSGDTFDTFVMEMECQRLARAAVVSGRRLHSATSTLARAFEGGAQ